VAFPTRSSTRRPVPLVEFDRHNEDPPSPARLVADRVLERLKGILLADEDIDGL
jgi:hypothetical protein